MPPFSAAGVAAGLSQAGSSRAGTPVQAIATSEKAALSAARVLANRRGGSRGSPLRRSSRSDRTSSEPVASSASTVATPIVSGSTPAPRKRASPRPRAQTNALTA